MARRLNITTLGALVVAGLAIVLIRPSISQAADLSAPYNPGVLGEQRTEFASGWYIRGDLGYEQASVNALTTSAAVAFGAPPVVFDPSSPRQNAYSLSLGGGYKLNNWFRFDLTGDIRKGLYGDRYGAALPCQIGYIANQAGTAETPVFSGGGCTPHSTSSLTRYDVLANAYVDLGTWSTVTPYVGVGAGTAFGRLGSTTTWRMQNGLPYQVSFTDALNPTINYYNNWDSSNSRSYVNFAWALMAGVAIDVADHVKLDIGYRYFNAGHLTIASGATTSSTALVSNEIRAGFRYMID